MPKKLLLVDDDPNFIYIFQKAFAQKGYNVLTAKDGEEGYDITLKDHPDLVVLDMNMPNMDGLTYLQKVRSNSAISELPVIVASQYSESSVMKSCRDYHIKDYIIKVDHSIKDIVSMIEAVFTDLDKNSKPINPAL